MQAARDGIPYWDTAAPQLLKLGECRHKPSDPFNDYEPVDSSAAAIAGQGLWRLGTYLQGRSENPESGKRYRQAAITIANTLFDEPYLPTHPQHQGWTRGAEVRGRTAVSSKRCGTRSALGRGQGIKERDPSSRPR